MISCLHPLQDDRIYWKEALSLKKHGYNIVHLGVDSEEKDFLTEHGVRLISVKKKVYFNNPYFDKFFRTITLRKSIYKTLYNKALSLQAVVYHLHDIQLNRIGPKLKKSAHSPRIVYDVHEPYPEIVRYLHRRTGPLKLFRIFLSNYIGKRQLSKSKSYDLVITTEEGVAQSFINYNPEQNVSVIYNYCNLEPESSDNKIDKTYDAIYSGGISGFRGIYTMLGAAVLAKKNNTPVKILVLGNFKEPLLKEKIEKLIANEGIEAFIELKSFVPFEKVKDFYMQSRCGLVLFDDLEVYRHIWPIKMFEYMCFGLPIITSGFGHTYETVKKHNCGVGIDSSSAEQLLQSILRYKNPSGPYVNHPENAIEAFRNNYSWDKMESKLLELYNKLLY